MGECLAAFGAELVGLVQDGRYTPLFIKGRERQGDLPNGLDQKCLTVANGVACQISISACGRKW